MVARMALVRIASVLPAFVSDPQAFPDRLFFSRAAAGYGHLLDAVLVASAFELRREVGVAVSYTHLDVYKRQTSYSSGGRS